VTNHLVDTGAAAFGVAKVSKRCRNMLVLLRVVKNKPVDFLRRNPWLDVPTHVIHQLSIELTSGTHPHTLKFCQLKLADILKHATLGNGTFPIIFAPVYPLCEVSSNRDFSLVNVKQLPQLFLKLATIP
jgi:hypothetical protein